MKKPTTKSLSLVGFVLSGILSGAIVHAEQLQMNAPTEQDLEAATVLSEMISRGHVAVDPNTGKLVLKSAVLQVLKDFNLVPTTKTPGVTAMGGCSGTTGDGGGTYRPER